MSPRAQTLEPMHATSTELSPGERPIGFFCCTGCPFLAAWVMASLFWVARSCWVGNTGFSHLARGRSLCWGPERPFSALALFSPQIN
eukprot:1137662-Pelagomonas_calceolata.AAC.12